ncbi:MAG: hypothetical protein AAF560_04390 [Acidobacteriota bacterium]
MDFGNVAFWLFLAATVVATLTFVSIIVWAEKRLKERQEFYKFEFRKKMVEAGKMDAGSLASLAQYEHELSQQQVRQKVLVAGLVIFGTGLGICLGFQFLSGEIWKLGYIPLCVGGCMLAYGLLVAGKSNPGPPPLGWSPETRERD